MDLKQDEDDIFSPLRFDISLNESTVSSFDHSVTPSDLDEMSSVSSLEALMEEKAAKFNKCQRDVKPSNLEVKIAERQASKNENESHAATADKKDNAKNSTYSKANTSMNLFTESPREFSKSTWRKKSDEKDLKTVQHHKNSNFRHEIKDTPTSIFIYEGENINKMATRNRRNSKYPFQDCAKNEIQDSSSINLNCLESGLVNSSNKENMSKSSCDLGKKSKGNNSSSINIATAALSTKNSKTLRKCKTMQQKEINELFTKTTHERKLQELNDGHDKQHQTNSMEKSIQLAVSLECDNIRCQLQDQQMIFHKNMQKIVMDIKKHHEENEYLFSIIDELIKENQTLMKALSSQK